MAERKVATFGCGCPSMAYTGHRMVADKYPILLCEKHEREFITTNSVTLRRVLDGPRYPQPAGASEAPE